MKNGIIATIGVLCVYVTGCSSFTSSYIGGAKTGDKFDGMPVVVQRPKYLKVTYKKVTYRLLAAHTERKGQDAVESMVQVGQDQVVNEVSTEIVTVGEVWAMDLKRPGAGSTDYTVEFDPNSQYPKKVGAKVQDDTIKQVGESFGNVLKNVAEAFKLASSGTTEKKTELVKVSEEVSRIDLILLDDPTKVAQFKP